MNESLVARLRAALLYTGPTLYVAQGSISRLPAEAADHIDALTAENARLKAALALLDRIDSLERRAAALPVGGVAFEAVWRAIREWDIRRPGEAAYHGPTGDDVRWILAALATETPDVPRA